MRRLAAFLIAVLQPPDTEEGWIALGEVARRVSRKRQCSVQEVNASLHGDAVPALDIVDAVIGLRAELSNKRDSSRSERIFHDEAEKLRTRALSSQRNFRHTQPFRSQRPSRRLVKGLSWAAGIAGTAAITLLVTGVIPGALSQIFNGSKIKDTIRQGPDIITSESMYHPDGNGVPLPTVVPGSYYPPGELVRALSRPMAAASAPVEKQISDAHGVETQSIFTRVILQGNRNEPIRILNIYPVDLRRVDPLDGVLFDIGGQGVGSNIQMDFNLDQPSPHALNVNELDHVTNQPFFENHTISLADGEQAVLVIQADTNCYSASFDLSISYTVGDTVHTEIINDNGKPFRVSAYRYTKTGLLSYRQDFELQGNFSVIPLDRRQITPISYSQMQVIRACPYISSGRS